MIVFSRRERETAAELKKVLFEHGFRIFTPRRRLGEGDFLACRIDGSSVTPQRTAVIVRPLRRGKSRGRLEIVFLEPASPAFRAWPWPDLLPALAETLGERIAVRPYAYNEGALREGGWRWEDLVARSERPRTLSF